MIFLVFFLIIATECVSDCEIPRVCPFNLVAGLFRPTPTVQAAPPAAVKREGPYSAYTSKQVLHRDLPPDHLALLDAVHQWAGTDLQTSESGRKCWFPKALKEGQLAFAVMHTNGNERHDYELLDESFGTLIQNTFPEPLTRENAPHINKTCLIIAMPDYYDKIGPFRRIQNEVRNNHVGLDLRKGIMVTSRVPHEPQLSQGFPFPIIAIRYLSPADRGLIALMQNPAIVMQRWSQVYG